MVLPAVLAMRNTDLLSQSKRSHYEIVLLPFVENKNKMRT